ncbi:MAG: EAL domain-containing protein [Azoarcus sp.]|jgi:diguanylate cyclase (GGDEF)-like protein|nr:EAL domain-containing protein [Azoarcus sp.]
MSRHSFQARVTGWGILTGTIVLALMLVINLHSVDAQIERQTQAHIESTIVAYRAVLVVSLVEHDYATLHDILSAWKQSGDVTYIAVTDASGNRLATMGIENDVPLPPVDRTDPAVRHIRFDVDYLGQHYGTVQYGLSTQSLVLTRNRLILYNALIALTGIVLFCVLLMLISSYIVKPLLLLSKAAERISSGDYDVKLQTTGLAEIDHLSTLFSTMALTVSSKISLLEWQAHHDALTDMFNRRAFEMYMAELLADPAVVDVSLLYIDLDQFKAINDSCGHTAGDALLTRIAHLLESLLGDAFIARIGGDEFGAIVTLASEEDVNVLAQGIIESIDNIHFVWEGQTYRVGASVGVASSRALDTRSLKDLMIAADTACFGAKELGRNRLQIYRPNDDYFCQRREELRSVAQLDNALAQDRFVLYHQRFMSLDNCPSHAEILLRVRNAEGGIETPAHFIHAAERYNLMPHIDRWVVENACRQIAQWEKKQCDVGIERFGINISGASLSDERFPDFVLGQINASGVNPKRLCFEITESAAVANLKLALNFIERVRHVGVSVALDDFGSGLSSFAYLRRFHADYLKVDGTFISNIDNDPANLATVKAIVTLARAYHLHTVAEFVHKKSILDIIREIGIDYAQGFHCHEPEPLIILEKP